MRKLGVLFCCLALVAWAGPSMAKVSGPCSDCHTMHNSQDGAVDETLTGVPLTGGPYGALTKGDCVICHTGTNAGTGARTNSIPYVNSTGAPTYGTNGTTGDTLAGGNFYYVTQNDTYGHNVDVVGGVDGNIGANLPPGFGTGKAAEDGTTPALGVGGNWAANQLTCAGTYGCHGTHADGTGNWGAVSGGHHSGADGAITDAGTGAGATAPKGYRFLVGIEGYEDSDHEYQPTDTAHNQYKGVDAPTTPNKSTISYLCAECHGDFHGSAANIGSSSPWLRHPTDLDLPNATGTEYQYYNGDDGAGTAAYSVSAPVASADVSAVLSVVTATGASADTAIVTCISCHRAHATPYADLLRWDYSGLEAGDGVAGQQTDGCFVCHTTKDDD